MDGLAGEWIDLVVRWAHVLFGMAWIGTSFYFVWLDSWIAPPARPRPGVEGELWLVHSGGFYRIEKIKVAPQELPQTLHWFKWEAGFTWLSGVALLALTYYLGAGAVYDGLSAAASVGVTSVGLALSWLLYDRLCRTLADRPAMLAPLGFALFLALTWLLIRFMPAHAAYMHVGAVLGTLMAANVWLTIVPNQRELVAATKAGRPPDATMAISAKQRSMHNNYMTLPVVFIMLSSHYPSTYGSEWNWILLGGLSLVGAAARHWINQHDRGKAQHWIWPAAAAVTVGLFLLARTG